MHIYNRHYRREKIFLEWKDVGRFRKMLIRCSGKYGIKIESYAIMDNHFHLLADGGDIPKFMMSIQRGYAQYFNSKYRRDGQVFERRYCSKKVETIEYLKNMKKYVLINPIDRVLEIEIRKMISSRDVGVLWSDQ